MKFRISIAFLSLLILNACNYEYVDEPRDRDLDVELAYTIKKTSATGELDHYVLPSRENLSEIPQDPKNPLNYPKVELGQYLFFETGIATDAMLVENVGTYSCSTCHIPEVGFRPGIAQGIADGGVGFGHFGDGRKQRPNYDNLEIDAQGIRPLTVLNAAMFTNTQWAGHFGGNFVNEGLDHLWNVEDGSIHNADGYYGMETQNIEGMELHRMSMDRDLAVELGYKDMFDQAFPDFKESERYTKETTALALSAYIRSLLTTEAPFQKWLKGEHEAMTDIMKEGGLIFFDKAGCFKCHKNANLGANEFHAVGVYDIDQTGNRIVLDNTRKNLGRGFFTKDPSDNYKFRVPQLYNLKDAIPYFHGGSAETLDEVIDYFDKAIPENPRVDKDNISSSFLSLGLTDDEKAKLKVFLEEALFDPHYDRFVPPYVKSGNCFPNNDEKSRIDLNCN